MVQQTPLTLLISLVLLLASMSPVSANDKEPQLRVAVASNFLMTARKLSASFEKKTGIRILLSSASSGKITTQIEAGAPYDLFLSADEARPERLVTNGLAIEESFAIYAIGQLTLVSRKALNEPIDFGNSRVAIANPKIAPYGLAAKQWLAERNLKPKLVFGENINQAWHFFQVGAAPFAIVAKAQVLQAPKRPEYQLALDVDETILKQAVVILKGAEANAAARQFHEYLLSESVQDQIQLAGYGVKPSNN